MSRGRWVYLIAGLATAAASCTPESSQDTSSSFDLLRTQPGITAGPRLAPDQVVVGQTIYVPIFSSIATADNARPIGLASTLTIRNLDERQPIEVSAVRYHDSGGKLVRNYLDRPLQIAPLGSLALFVRESDNTGGASPSFVIEWEAGADVVAPSADAVMISTAGAQGITLTSSSRVIAQRHR